MTPVAAAYWAAALLLVGAGTAKVRDPLPLVRALRAAGLAVRPTVLVRVTRVAAAAEAGLGLAALLVAGRPLALAVAASYAGFTAFVLRARAVGGPLASCGCFGRPDTPPTRAHVLLTAGLAAAATSAAVAPPPGLAAAGLPLLASTLALTVTAYLVLAVLPLLPRAGRA